MRPSGELIRHFGASPPKEPALVVGTASATVAGVLSLITLFFPNIPENTLQLILIATAFILPIVVALFTRGKVWSPASVKDLVIESVASATKTKDDLGPPKRREPPSLLG